MSHVAKRGGSTRRSSGKESRYGSVVALARDIVRLTQLQGRRESWNRALQAASCAIGKCADRLSKRRSSTKVAYTRESVDRALAEIARPSRPFSGYQLGRRSSPRPPSDLSAHLARLSIGSAARSSKAQARAQASAKARKSNRGDESRGRVRSSVPRGEAIDKELVIECDLTRDHLVKIISWLHDDQDASAVDLSPWARDANACISLGRFLGPSVAHLRILGYLGKGNHGLVLNVLDTSDPDRRTYALKLVRINPSEKRRAYMDDRDIRYLSPDEIMEELNLQSKFAEIGVALPLVGDVHVASVGERQFAWFLMHKIDATLQQYMTIPCTEAEMHQVALAVILLLHRLAAAQFTHSDPKPDNIGLVFRGDKAHLYLIDFGLSSTALAFPKYDYAWFLLLLRPSYVRAGVPKESAAEREVQHEQRVQNSLAFAKYIRRAIWNVFRHKYAATVWRWFGESYRIDEWGDTEEDALYALRNTLWATLQKKLDAATVQ